MHVIINTASVFGESVSITDDAAKLVRMSFNPSNFSRVNRLKALAAAFLSECDSIIAEYQGKESLPSAARSLATAKTNMQTASMWAVLGATTDA